MTCYRDTGRWGETMQKLTGGEINFFLRKQ